MSHCWVRPARPDEAGMLGALALRSKAHWGYAEDFLAACRIELTFRPEEIGPRRMTVAGRGDRVLGFYSLDGRPPHGELANLWVEPVAIGTGIGSALLRQAVATARAAGFTSVRIEADPHAEGFYLAMGAERTGLAPSGSLPGRLLPELFLYLD